MPLESYHDLESHVVPHGSHMARLATAQVGRRKRYPGAVTGIIDPKPTRTYAWYRRVRRWRWRWVLPTLGGRLKSCFTETQGEAADFPACENLMKCYDMLWHIIMIIYVNMQLIWYYIILINFTQYFSNSTCCAEIWRDVLDVSDYPLCQVRSTILHCFVVTCWFWRQRASNLERAITR